MRTLYLTDLDGTLLTTRQRVSPYTLAVLCRLTERGVLFTYATARSLTSARVVTEGLTPRLPVIVYNGGQIMDAATGKRLLLRQFTPEERAHLRALCPAHGVSPLVYAFVDGQERISWDATQLNPGKRFYLDSRRGDRRLRPLPGPAGLYDGEIFYYTCIGTEAELTPLYSALTRSGRYACTLQQELYRPEFWLEVMPRDATKREALLSLKEMLGCGRVVCFGDAVNDAPMFQAADECYAVASAVDALKAIATGVIGDNDSDGVARWLEAHAVPAENN